MQWSNWSNMTAAIVVSLAASCAQPPQEGEHESTRRVALTPAEAEQERQDLIERYIGDDAYTGFDSESGGVNHIAFITQDLEGTIEFYTQVIQLRLLRVRAMDGAPQSTQVFFDMGRGELLAFLRLSDVRETARIGVGGFHHLAMTVDREQYDAAKARLDERGIRYTTISHEILDTITLTDPNGITIELSVWNIDPGEVRM